MEKDRMYTDLDDIDLKILSILQENCKTSLNKIGQSIGLSAPSVMERIRKLEERGVVRGYHAELDARLLGLVVTAFVFLTGGQAKMVGDIEKAIVKLPGILECHHITGPYTLLLKVKTKSSKDLEKLLDEIWSMPGVDRTETMVALSTSSEHTRLALELLQRPVTAEPQPEKDRKFTRGDRRIKTFK